MRRGALIPVVLALALSAGCGGDDEPVAQPGLSPTTTVTPVEPVVPTSAPSTEAPSTCADEPVEQAVCRFLDAARAGDLASLSEGEQEAAGAVGDELPAGAYEVAVCELVGDVTVACEVTFAGAPQPLGFHVVPVNAEFDDGALITPEGEDVRYEVGGYLGTGEPGSFTTT